MTLLIATPGPLLPEDGHAQATAPPPLPALDSLLAAARRLDNAPDWRAGVLQALQAADASLPAIALVARGLPELASGTPLCLVTALHVVPGMSRVHLPADGILALDAVEREAWRDAFNREFGADQLLLHAVPGGWVMQAACAAAARDADPHTLLGQPLARSAAAGEAERNLRRLGAEVEMWLAAHPLNAMREARRQPPLNCLWFSGGGHALALPTFGSLPGVVLSPSGPDPWVAGLALHCGVPCVTAGVDWPLAQSAPDALVIAATAAALDARDQWQALEARWFEPAWHAWRAGAIRALRLQIGRSAWQLPSRSPLRWLRRRRAWWQAVQS
ncbi:MAG: hypothetical protein ABW278_14790 [Steroidobacteraceae bacterium]